MKLFKMDTTKVPHQKRKKRIRLRGVLLLRVCILILLLPLLDRLAGFIISKTTKTYLARVWEKMYTWVHENDDSLRLMEMQEFKGAISTAAHLQGTVGYFWANMDGIAQQGS